jgi:hypothetical protein
MIFERFRIIQKQKESATAKQYTAEDTHTNQAVILKRFLITQKASDGSRSGIPAEALRLTSFHALVKHSNIAAQQFIQKKGNSLVIVIGLPLEFKSFV